MSREKHINKTSLHDPFKGLTLLPKAYLSTFLRVLKTIFYKMEILLQCSLKSVQKKKNASLCPFSGKLEYINILSL